MKDRDEVHLHREELARIENDGNVRLVQSIGGMLGFLVVLVATYVFISTMYGHCYQ